MVNNFFVVVVLDVFGYDLHKSGLLIALPYLAMGIFVVLGGYLADRLRSRGMLSTSRVSTVNFHGCDMSTFSFPSFYHRIY